MADGERLIANSYGLLAMGGTPRTTPGDGIRGARANEKHKTTSHSNDPAASEDAHDDVTHDRAIPATLTARRFRVHGAKALNRSPCAATRSRDWAGMSEDRCMDRTSGSP